MTEVRRGGRSAAPGGGSKRGRAGVYLGRSGEDAAVGRLAEQGFRVLERNYRCRLGEIDIIAMDGDILCFIEVKARRSGAFGGGLEAVEARKQSRLRRAAGYYLTRFKTGLPPCRFDVVEVRLGQDGRPVETRLLRNAF